MLPSKWGRVASAVIKLVGPLPVSWWQGRVERAQVLAVECSQIAARALAVELDTPIPFVEVEGSGLKRWACDKCSHHRHLHGRRGRGRCVCCGCSGFRAARKAVH